LAIHGADFCESGAENAGVALGSRRLVAGGITVDKALREGLAATASAPSRAS